MPTKQCSRQKFGCNPHPISSAQQTIIDQAWVWEDRREYELHMCVWSVARVGALYVSKRVGGHFERLPLLGQGGLETFS